jgi:hypothetical protein
MTPLRLANRLVFVEVTVRAKGRSIVLKNVMIDTGSGGTIFNTDQMENLGLSQELSDRIVFIRGVGGRESVTQKIVDEIQVGDLVVSPMRIQMGALDYGFPSYGILGLDFLVAAKAIIDFSSLEIRKG